MKAAVTVRAASGCYLFGFDVEGSRGVFSGLGSEVDFGVVPTLGDFDLALVQSDGRLLVGVHVEDGPVREALAGSPSASWLQGPTRWAFQPVPGEVDKPLMASDLEHDAVFDELVRCPQCGSLNDPDAEWCGQCIADFEPEPEPPSGADVNVLGQRLVDPEPMLAPEVSSGLFGVEKGKAVWRCSRCFTRNPIETNACSECSLPYIESAKREAGAFTDQLSRESAGTTVGILGWSARIMMVIGGLLAPVVLFWTALAGAVALVLRKALGRDR